MFCGTGIEAIRSAITWKFDYESFPNGTKCKDFIYVCLKKIEEEGVGCVPTPQVLILQINSSIVLFFSGSSSNQHHKKYHAFCNRYRTAEDTNISFGM